MAGGLVGIPDFSPLNTVTPFTYRDNDTFLTRLETLTTKANAIVDAINQNDLDNALQHNTIVKTLTDQFNAALAAVQADLEAMVTDSHDESIAFNPTTGSRLDSLSKVISDTYDNTRIYAWFASQLDDFGWTAKQYDDFQRTARFFDLAPTYPTINAVQS